MPTFKPAPKAVADMAREILCAYNTHKPLLDAKVKIDFVFAYADENEQQLPRNFAITHHGRRVFGQARVIKLKDRVMGRGDAEITLDANWWDAASEQKQRALLDHELHHVLVKTDRHGRFEFEGVHRPVIGMRRHDFEIGWFTVIADRHGADSVECDQAARMMTEAGQYYWPGIAVKRGA